MVGLIAEMVGVKSSAECGWSMSLTEAVIPLIRDSTIIKLNRMLSETNGSFVMSHHQHGPAGLCKFFQRFQDGLSAFLVQVSSGFIGQ